jgi:predicted metal-dependent hydrolase
LKPERPRDELGRPQPWDADNRLEMPDFDRSSLEENHRLGIRFFEEGRYFPAHEAWETAWKQARGTGDAEFFKGLSQLGAGYVHLLRGNRHGAFTLMRRGAGRIERYPDGHLGIATASLADRARADADAVERGDLATGEAARFDPLPLRA